MTRRIRPPKHPVTGHPYVDNELRNAWRWYRNYLRARPANVYLTLSANIWLWRPSSKPRKHRKDQRKSTYATAFRWHPTTYYTPERVILK